MGASYTIGLDIGGTKILGALLGPDGAVVAQVRRPTVRGAEGVVAGAAQAVRDLVDLGGTTLARVAGVGLGIPGIVDHAAGTVRHAVNLGVDGSELPLADLLSAEIDGVPVVVENDLNVAAVGAAHLLERDTPVHHRAAGAAPQSEDLAFVALGTGLAAGLVLEGDLRRGVSGAAGEIGHVPIDPAGPECACGQRGCLEMFASGTALATAWPAVHGKPSPVELFEAAAAGDPGAVAVKARFAGAVASAVRLLVLTVDVRHVVLGGGVSQLGEPLLEAVQDALHEQAEGSPFLTSLALHERVRIAPQGVPVAAVGAAVLGREGASRRGAVATDGDGGGDGGRRASARVPGGPDDGGHDWPHDETRS
ncbi:ROK family protein [Antribacter sp. KLBMP9083]|uniref:ROK family protein n=1 Tax=Antribacter soli TaxID=2910976 RepID=A0AA41QAC4_9MICO|nr:ROK family protein [Antribacter soli]MCF4119785.1 ROK family protein [Antribacter soli]